MEALRNLLNTGDTSRVRALAPSISSEDCHDLLSSLTNSNSKFQDLRLALMLPKIRADSIRKGIWLIQMKYFTSQEVVRLLPEFHLALRDELMDLCSYSKRTVLSDDERNDLNGDSDGSSISSDSDSDTDVNSDLGDNVLRSKSRTIITSLLLVFLLMLQMDFQRKPCRCMFHHFY